MISFFIFLEENKKDRTVLIVFDNFFMKDAKFASAKFNYAVINES